MKTIEQAAKDYVKHKYEEFALLDIIGEDTSIKDLRNDFIAGAEFAIKWIPVERDKDGLVKNSTIDEMESNAPFITRLNNGEEFQYDIWYEFSADIDFDQFYTHWRPIELK